MTAEQEDVDASAPLDDTAAIEALRFVRDTLQRAANMAARPTIAQLNAMLKRADVALAAIEQAREENQKLSDWLRMMSTDGNVHPADQKRLKAASLRLAALSKARGEA